jgi:hypothetical protein
VQALGHRRSWNSLASGLSGFLDRSHIAKGDLRHTDSRQQRELATLCLPQAFVTSVRLLCEREVPLTHRLPAICLLEMHRKKGSLSLSLRFLLPMSELGQNRKSAVAIVRSASPPAPDIVGYIGHVRKVPILLQKSAAADGPVGHFGISGRL